MPQKNILYVIYMPYTLDEYSIAHSYTTCMVSLREADGGMKVSVLDNYPMENSDLGPCQFSKKILDFSKKVPGIFRMVAPSGSLTMTEISHNARSKCRTVYTSGALSEKKFTARIDTLFFPEYKPAVDPFSTMPPTDYCEVLDLFRENPLIPDDKKERYAEVCTKYAPAWEKSTKNIITIFKRVQIDLHMPFIGKRYIGEVEKFIRKIFIQGHQEIISYHDEWKDLSMEQIREKEEQTKKELDLKYPQKKKS